MVEDCGSRRPGGDPGSLVAVRHHRLGFAKCRRVGPKHGYHLIGTHGALRQRRRLSLVRAVVIKDFLQRQLLAEFFNHDSAVLVDLLDGKVDSFSLILSGLGFSSGNRQHHSDFDRISPRFVTGAAQGERHHQSNSNGPNPHLLAN